jgi:hypothetical protein
MAGARRKTATKSFLSAVNNVGKIHLIHHQSDNQSYSHCGKYVSKYQATHWKDKVTCESCKKYFMYK